MTALICFIQETCFNPLLVFTNLVWASRSLWMSWYIDKHASSQNKMLNMTKQRRQNAKACNQNSFLCWSMSALISLGNSSTNIHLKVWIQKHVFLSNQGMIIIDQDTCSWASFISFIITSLFSFFGWHLTSWQYFIQSMMFFKFQIHKRMFHQWFL